MTSTFARNAVGPLKVTKFDTNILKTVRSGLNVLRKINGLLCGENDSEGPMCRNPHVSLILSYFLLCLYLYKIQTQFIQTLRNRHLAKSANVI